MRASSKDFVSSCYLPLRFAGAFSSNHNRNHNHNHNHKQK
eukprot:COSAG06_NODE_21764_length_746_cov_0.911901_2_plen_39_part_01